jgi:glutamate/tyrosine decarboxylase-like PLP-dependent enzyme
MAVVCFRALPEPGAEGAERDARSDELNRALVEAVNATGRAYLTYTTLRGRVAARVAFGNVLTGERHAAALLALLEAEAARLRRA